MGSRAVVVVCRDEEAARRRFGVADEGVGIVYTRTGRRFFDDARVERERCSACRTRARSLRRSGTTRHRLGRCSTAS